MAEHVKAGTLAAGAMASAVAPTVSVKTGTVAATARASAPAPTVVILGSVALAYILAEPHYHVPAHDDDPVALGTEVGLVALVVLVVGWKVVARRLVRLSPTD